MKKISLCRQNASSSNSLNLLLCRPREEPCLDNHRLLGQITPAKDLEVTGSGYINDGRLLCVLLVLGPGLLRHKSPQLVKVDGRAVLVDGVGVNMEVPHADLAKVSRMVLVKVDPVVMLTSGVTATSGMLAVLANASVSVRDVAAELAGLLLVGRHL